MITLYGLNTPNSHKISVALEELGLSYEIKEVDVRSGGNKGVDFLRINPNGKIPVIIDHDTGTRVFESCAILMYLSSKTGKLMPEVPNQRWEALQWLFFQAASVGPMLGQLAWFTYYAGEPIPYAIKRYSDEANRLFAVMNKQLEGRRWFISNYSIVDIAHFGWMHCIREMHIDFSAHTALMGWYERMCERPAVQRGIAVPRNLPGWDITAQLS